LEKDFRELREHVEKSGLLKPNPLFFILQLLQIFLLEVAAYLLISWYNGNWTSFIIAAFVLATAQVNI
jgi:hypothetical protein